MARQWKALPLTGSTTPVALKAPTYKDYQSQQSPDWIPDKGTAEEILVAADVIEFLDAEEIRLPQGAAYKVWRYPQGVAVEVPSGWIVYRPLASQVLHSTGAQQVLSGGQSAQRT